ncbi:MAG: hypothetical protein ABI778_02650 [Ignavibacteriota bacterium]
MKKTTPSSFAKNKLKLHMWSKFSEIFEAIESGERRILIRSANGVGKTTALAAICNWKLSNSEECIVLTTSSSQKQVRHNLWGEIRRQAIRSNLYEPKAITDTRIKLDEKRYMLAVNPAKPESAQGFHAASILIAIDEATAIRRDIISSLIATATGDDVTIVMIYNPMSEDSFACEAERSGKWKIISISALEHPNIIENKNLIPGAVTCSSTAERFELWNEEVPPGTPDAVAFNGKWWQRTLEVSRRILGEWHSESGEGLIPMKLIRNSLAVAPVRGIKSLGVDVAAGGKDKTVFARFDGNVQLPFRILHTSDTPMILRAIEEEYRKGFTTIAIDETAAVGRLTPLLREKGIAAASIHFAAKPMGFHDLPHSKLANKRIEMYYNIFDELRAGAIKLLDDDMLHAELAAVRLSSSPIGERYYLEKKKEIRSRLGRSPDRADATALARYALQCATRTAISKLEILRGPKRNNGWYGD